MQGRSPLRCRMTSEPHSWRAMLLEAHRAESELLSHKDFPVDDLRRELGLIKPLFETMFALTAGAGAELAEETVLRVGFVEHDGLVLRLRYKTEMLDADCAARIAGYHVTALALIAADPDAEHARQSLLSAEELRSSLMVSPDRAESCRNAGSTSCSRSEFGRTRTPLRPCTATDTGRTGSSMLRPIGWHELWWCGGCLAKVSSQW